MTAATRQTRLPIRDYNLEETLRSGQAFRWRQVDGGWEGVLGSRWVRLSHTPEAILAQTAEPVREWDWLRRYLQTDVSLQGVLQSFPDDEPMRRSVAACRGLRLLRQDPWECLAGFILSSNKQILQIEQMVAELCRRFGNPLVVPAGHAQAFSFPSPERLAQAQESELRACRLGYRAPYLLATSKQVAAGAMDLDALAAQTVDQARAALLQLPGVGPKIADCVLLFACGFAEVFPVDVWIHKALRQLYFPGQQPSRRRLQDFTATYFGAQAGYAQQYPFHYVRVANRLPRSAPATPAHHPLPTCL